MICGRQHNAMAYRVRRTPFGHQLPPEPVIETVPLTLYCGKPEEHDPAPHACRLPAEAGEDAGKVFEWP